MTLNDMMDWLAAGDFGSAPTNFIGLLLSVTLAFLCGHVIALIYMLTHSGLSYSRSFVNSLIVMPTIVSVVMIVLSNNLVIAFGMMAVFAIVRFRNILRDTLDTTYVLSVIVLGMACGTMKYTTALVACAVISLIMLYLWYTEFGSRHRYDVILNLHWARGLGDLPALSELLRRHALSTECASQNGTGGAEGADLSYRLLLRDPDRMDLLLSELKNFPGVTRVSGLKADQESEI